MDAKCHQVILQGINAASDRLSNLPLLALGDYLVARLKLGANFIQHPTDHIFPGRYLNRLAFLPRPPIQLVARNPLQLPPYAKELSELGWPTFHEMDNGRYVGDLPTDIFAGPDITDAPLAGYAARLVALADEVFMDAPQPDHQGQDELDHILSILQVGRGGKNHRYL
jgi:hypothetical protein